MLEILFGSQTARKVLLFLANYGEGYAQEIADLYEIPINMVQNQLKKFEQSGLLVSLNKGKTRIYTWNPRWPLRQELLQLLKKALSFLPSTEIKKYYRLRKRPRRTGKPL
jgi:DNA-binding transcriptional ArsR family regulator